MSGPPEPVDRNALFQNAVRAATEGISGNAWMRSLSESGSGIRRSVGLALYGEARRVAASYGAQAGLPPDAPVPLDQMGRWPTNQATGILYHAQVSYKERGTDAIKSWSVNFKSGETISPQETVNRAVDMMADKAEDYRLDLTGAVFTGAHLLVSSSAA